MILTIVIIIVHQHDDYYNMMVMMRTGRMTIINNDIYMIKHDTHGVWMMDDG
jgi:hypothetical protein